MSTEPGQVQTVYKYLRLTAPPERRPVSRTVSALAPYEGYLLRRWAEGCRNARQLWREIQAQGYRGVYRLPRAGAERRGPAGDGSDHRLSAA